MAWETAAFWEPYIPHPNDASECYILNNGLRLHRTREAQRNPHELSPAGRAIGVERCGPRRRSSVSTSFAAVPRPEVYAECALP